MFRTKERQFKKSIDVEETRRQREAASIQLKSKAREEALLSRRRKVDHSEDAKSPQSKALMAQKMLAELPLLVQNIQSQDADLQVEAAQKIRRLLSIERHPPIDAVIESGVVPRLVQFLQAEQFPKLQFEAAWALTNIASGNSSNTRHVTDHGAVPIFVTLLSSRHANVKEQAVWALGNIAGDSHQLRDLVLSCGAVPPLLALMVPEAPVTMLRNATWTLSNFCRGKPQPEFSYVADALPVLSRVIQSKDPEVLTDACWALSYLSDDPNEDGPHNQKIQKVIDAHVPTRLIQLLLNKNTNVQIPALRTVGNIVTGDDMQTQVVINGGALPSLSALLNSPVRGIKKEACWTISNITAGNADQIQRVIDARIMPYLVNILEVSEFDIKKEAAWAISNATTGGNPQQKRYLADVGVIPGLCSLFEVDDVKIVMIALEGVENILRVGKADAEQKGTVNQYADIVEECGGLDKLEDLQHGDNRQIYDKSVSIIREFFGEEDPVAPGMVPVTTQSGMLAFGAPAAFGGAPGTQPFSFPQ
jgi:hypothetical protein